MDARLRIDPELKAPVYHAQIDPEVLVATHTALVRKIAWFVHARISTAMDMEELVQIGMIALIEAARAFENRGQAVFATYATWRVRGAMIDKLRKSATLSRDGRRHKRELGAARNSLEGALGRTANNTEMAEKLGLSLKEYNAVESTTNGTTYVSMDAVYSDHSEWFADPAPDALASLHLGRLKSAVAAAIGELPEREQLILQLYYVEELRLEDIGRTLNVCAARVCQIKNAALDRLRVTLGGWGEA